MCVLALYVQRVFYFSTQVVNFPSEISKEIVIIIFLNLQKVICDYHTPVHKSVSVNTDADSDINSQNYVFNCLN